MSYRHIEFAISHRTHYLSIQSLGNIWKLKVNECAPKRIVGIEVVPSKCDEQDLQ